MSSDEQALQFLRAGRLAEAEQLFLAIVQAEPVNSGARHFLGIIRFQQGRPAEALEWISASLELNRDADVLTSLGNVLHALGRSGEALESFDSALTLKPGLINALYNRGAALSSMKRYREALSSYDRALALNPDDAETLVNRSAVLLELNRPAEALAGAQKAAALARDFAEAWNNGGIALLALARPQEALASFDRALAIRPGYAEAHNGRGLALKDLKQPLEALEAFNQAVATNPLYAEAWNDRGDVLVRSDRKTEALASYDKALAIRPDYVEAFYNRANLFNDFRRFEDALASYDKVLGLDPGHARAWNSRGTLLWRMRRFDDALTSYDRALAINPDDADVLHKRGNMRWAELKDLDGAIADLEKAYRANPDSEYLRGDLLHLKMHQADWRQFDTLKTEIDEGVRDGKPVVQPLYYLTMTDSPAAQLACARAYSAARYPPAPAKEMKKPRRRHEKIRLGYLAGEFRLHPVGLLSVGLFEQHDKNKFEIIAFDNDRDDGSQVRSRMRAAFDRMIDISGLTDQAAAQMIEAEEIDILVDMIGYTRNHRMGVFARRPAPLQVSYWGFPGTLGSSAIDYIIADRILIPQRERQFYAEQIVFLPHSYMPNDSRRALPGALPGRAENGLPEKAFVFCNFNHIHKLTPANFAVWMRILQQVPDSVLWLLESNRRCAENLRASAAALGVTGERLVFAPQLPQEAHIARLGLADLSLDTLPYNAHTTASDALWVGLPLVTCAGNAFAARVAASVLNAIGLPELVTENWQDYEALTVSLARDPARLRAIRGKINAQRSLAPLFDTARYCRHMENAFAAMWDRVLRGEPPQSFAVRAEGT